MINAKGKGEMQTFWMESKVSSGSSTHSGSTNSDDMVSKTETDEKKWEVAGLRPKREELVDETDPTMNSKVRRLVQWNADILARLLRQIIAYRKASRAASHLPGTTNRSSTTSHGVEASTMAINEVKEIIQLPEFDPIAARNQEDPECIAIDTVVIEQLKEFVMMIATMYRDNAFHR